LYQKLKKAKNWHFYFWHFLTSFKIIQLSTTFVPKRVPKIQVTKKLAPFESAKRKKLARKILYVLIQLQYILCQLFKAI